MALSRLSENEKLSEALRAQIITLRDEGLSVNDIAAQVNCGVCIYLIAKDWSIFQTNVINSFSYFKIFFITVWGGLVKWFVDQQN